MISVKKTVLKLDLHYNEFSPGEVSKLFVPELYVTVTDLCQ